MGTTLAAAALVHEGDDEVLAVVNVGDSRVYLFRDGELSQITEDHSLVEELVRSGRISAEEAHAHPQRHVVTRALGMGPEVDVDVFPIVPYRGDRLVLASDGLFNDVADEDIARLLRRVPDPEQAPNQPTKTESGAGLAYSVTVLFLGNCSCHGKFVPPTSAPGATPSQPLATPPEPVPALFTESVTPGASFTKVATTWRGPLIGTLHDVANPEQAPLQSARCQPDAAAAATSATEPCVQLGAPPEHVAVTLLGVAMS